MAWLPLVLGLMPICGAETCVLRQDAPARIVEAVRGLSGGRLESVNAGRDLLTARVCLDGGDCHDFRMNSPVGPCPGRVARALCLVSDGGIPDALQMAWAERLATIPALELWAPLIEETREAPSPSEPQTTGSLALWALAMALILLPLLLGLGIGFLLSRRGLPRTCPGLLALLAPLAVWGAYPTRLVFVGLWDALLVALAFGLGVLAGAWGGTRPAISRIIVGGLALMTGAWVVGEVLCRMMLPTLPPDPVPGGRELWDASTWALARRGILEGRLPIPPVRALGGSFSGAVVHLMRIPEDCPETRVFESVISEMARMDSLLWHVAYPVAPGAEPRTWERLQRWMTAERVLGVVVHSSPEEGQELQAEMGNAGLRVEQADERIPAVPCSPPPFPVRVASRVSRLAAVLAGPFGQRCAQTELLVLEGTVRSFPGLVRETVLKAVQEGIPVALVSASSTLRGDGGAPVEGPREVAERPEPPQSLPMILDVPMPWPPSECTGPIHEETLSAWARRLEDRLAPLKDRARVLEESRRRDPSSSLPDPFRKGDHPEPPTGDADPPGRSP